MTYLVLVSPEGRIVTANRPQLRWQNSPLQLPRWTPGKSRLYKIDHRAFWWRDEERVQGVGRFSVKQKGELALDLTAPLPLWVRSVSSITATGNRIAVETAPFTCRVLGWTRTGWRTIVESFYTAPGREKPERADVYLSQKGDALCVVATSHLSSKTLFSYSTPYSIYQDTVTEHGLVPGPGLMQMVLASGDGWYTSTLSDGKARTRRLSLVPGTNQVLWEAFAAGTVVAPLTMGRVALYDRTKGTVRFGASLVGKVPADVPPTSLYYWHGVGAVSDVPETDTLSINERGFRRPVAGNDSPLFLVPPV